LAECDDDDLYTIVVCVCPEVPEIPLVHVSSQNERIERLEEFIVLLMDPGAFKRVAECIDPVVMKNAELCGHCFHILRIDIILMQRFLQAAGELRLFTAHICMEVNIMLRISAEKACDRDAADHRKLFSAGIIRHIVHVRAARDQYIHMHPLPSLTNYP